VRLTVNRTDWLAHVQATAGAYGHGLVPVVKGNGYGLGRRTLHEVVRSAGARFVAIGDVHELHDVPSTLTPVVLTPTLAAPTSDRPILTVGHLAHVDALRGWAGRVVVKLRSSMLRHGVAPGDLADLLTATREAGLRVEAFALHLPLAGTDADRLAEIERWLPRLEPGTAIWVSHLTPASFHGLQSAHPEHTWSVRVGSALWHGSPKGPFLHLTADALSVQPVSAGQPAGYRATPVPFDGTVVTVGAGSTAGVAPLDHPDPAQRSPFHFARRRLALVEGPHMHASLVFVPEGEPCPAVGDEVDVQRPLVTTNADDVRWR
jgi:alanine racemase